MGKFSLFYLMFVFHAQCFSRFKETNPEALAKFESPLCKDLVIIVTNEVTSFKGSVLYINIESSPYEVARKIESVIHDLESYFVSSLDQEYVGPKISNS